MTVQLFVEGMQTPTHGVVQLTVTDPDATVAGVTFSVVGGDGVRREPLVPDARVGNRYDKRLVLHERHSTRVEPLVTLADGSILYATPAMFGVRFEPLGVPAPTFDWFSAGGSAWWLWVSAGRGADAPTWRCWAARGRWPTAEDTAAGSLDLRYLRHDTLLDLGAGDDVGTTAEPGSWHVIAVPFNRAGQPGSRRTAVVQVPS